MIDSKTLVTPVAKAVVHSAGDRPEKPPVGAIHRNVERGYDEKWDGMDWVPYRQPLDKTKAPA